MPAGLQVDAALPRGEVILGKTKMCQFDSGPEKFGGGINILQIACPEIHPRRMPVELQCRGFESRSVYLVTDMQVAQW